MTSTPMQITEYLRRIGFQGASDVSYATLASLHQAHLLAIPYENLDIALDRYLTLDEQSIYNKIVLAGRGGWCYEMNGLFAWALRQLGFSVILLSSAVNRAKQGDSAEHSHLILLVMLDRPYLVDVGYGNGFLTPVPLEPGTYTQGFLSYALTRQGDRWFFQNQPYGAMGYDFTLEPYTLSDFSAKCHELQTAPVSGFVRLTVCHRFTTQGLISLRGAILQTITAQGASELIIDDEALYRSVLHDQFSISLPDAEMAMLWKIVHQRHLDWTSAQGH